MIYPPSRTHPSNFSLRHLPDIRILCWFSPPTGGPGHRHKRALQCASRATILLFLLKGAAKKPSQAPAHAAVPEHSGPLYILFPGSGVINGIKNLGLFRKVVLSRVKEVLTDITATAKQLAEPGAADKIQSAQDWTAEEKRKIAEFLMLP
jgi:hypothetical protein